MAEIHELQPVDLREAWRHEAHNFTPWLAKRLPLLGKELNLDLELVGTEVTLPDAGRVDILAKQAGSGANVVIENQLNQSDDSHCLRLLGYAANAGADILIWVAEGFTKYHRSIVAWLNESDSINVYAVRARAYRVGDSLAADFELAVGPSEMPPEPTSSSATNTNTWYANFYRPLVEQLRRDGLTPVGIGGFRGQWRSFETGYPQTVYAVGWSDGTAQAFLQTYGDDKKRVYEGLMEHRAEIDAALNNEVIWEAEGHEYWVRLETKNMPIVGEADYERTRQWLAGNLLRLHKVIQPYLSQACGTPLPAELTLNINRWGGYSWESTRFSYPRRESAQAAAAAERENGHNAQIEKIPINAQGKSSWGEGWEKLDGSYVVWKTTTSVRVERGQEVEERRVADAETSE